MGLSDPKHTNQANPGVSKPTGWVTSLRQVASETQTNQIRGITSTGASGQGIPKHITDVHTTVTEASAGSTSTVSVVFRRDPSDTAYSGVSVWVKGYQGNASPVQVASGTDSPITFVLNNTGETLSFIAQATGNGGSAPILSAPTTGVKLPIGGSGGFGPTTNTGISGSGTVGALAKFTATTTIGSANLTGDTSTSNTTAVTVTGIQTTPVTSNTPRKGDIFRYNQYGDGKYDLCASPGRSIWCIGGTTALLNFGGVNQLGTASAPLPHSDNDCLPTDFSATATGSTSTRIGVTQVVNGSGGLIPPNTINRYSNLWMPTSSSNVRYWLGLSQALTLNTTTFASDTPNAIYAAFRYSAGTDSVYQAVAGTSNVLQTVASTGISLDTTTPHLFEIVPASGTYYFYIDGALVATVASHTPASTARLAPFWCGDNKNTANTTVATHYWMNLSLT